MLHNFPQMGQREKEENGGRDKREGWREELERIGWRGSLRESGEINSDRDGARQHAGELYANSEQWLLIARKKLASVEYSIRKTVHHRMA